MFTAHPIDVMVEDAAWTPLTLADAPAYLVLFVIGLGLIYLGFRRYRTSQLIANTPTQSVRSLAAGRAELEGIARTAERTLDQPFTEGSCVCAAYEIEEERETDDDDDEMEWVTLAEGQLAVPFYLEDDTGRVLIEATDVDLVISDENETEITVDERESDPVYVFEFLRNGGPVDDDGTVVSKLDGIEPHVDRRRRYSQSVLPVDEDVYVFGYAEIRDDQPETSVETEDRLVMTGDEMTGRFVVSDMDEERVSSSLRIQAPVLIVLGVLTSTVSLYVILSLIGV